jgi:hypothetical protein
MVAGSRERMIVSDRRGGKRKGGRDREREMH